MSSKHVFHINSTWVFCLYTTASSGGGKGVIVNLMTKLSFKEKWSNKKTLLFIILLIAGLQVLGRIIIPIMGYSMPLSLYALIYGTISYYIVGDRGGTAGESWGAFFISFLLVESYVLAILVLFYLWYLLHKYDSDRTVYLTQKKPHPTQS